MATMLLRRQCLPAPPKSRALVRKAWAAPTDAMTFFLEVLKFLGTVGLILTTGVILLMVG